MVTLTNGRVYLLTLVYFWVQWSSYQDTLYWCIYKGRGTGNNFLILALIQFCMAALIKEPYITRLTWRIRLNTAIIRQIRWVYHRSCDMKSSILYESRQIKYFLQQITDINIKTVYLIKSYLLRSEVGSRIKLRCDDIVVGGRHCYSKNEVMTKFLVDSNYY
jgi:hypothetical protein